MIQGIYQAAAAMVGELVRQDIRAHNLANVNTNGFKRTVARLVRGGDPRQQGIVAQSVDLTPGELQSTGAPLDLALRGSGYFVLDTGAGRQYTRNGHFMLDRNGYLVNGQGFRVLGTRGPIRVPSGGQVLVADDGTITSDGKVIDRLLVVDFGATGQLQHNPNTALTGAPAPTQVARASVVQGYLEASNVQPVLEMVGMTEGYRIYEANAKAITEVDRSLGRLIEAATG
jgi:flagellar basal body rod protein FlgG